MVDLPKKEIKKIADQFDAILDALPKAFLKKWCDERNIPVKLITMHYNRAEVVQLRKEAMKAFRARYPNMSYPAMGRIFNRNHTTIMDALGTRKRQSHGRKHRAEKKHDV